MPQNAKPISSVSCFYDILQFFKEKNIDVSYKGGISYACEYLTFSFDDEKWGIGVMLTYTQYINFEMYDFENKSYFVEAYDANNFHEMLEFISQSLAQNSLIKITPEIEL